jgi:osmotically-inducible protein OsmY
MRPTPAAINRPDAQIFVEARHALDERLSVPATVHLHVNHGVITLTGSVRLPSQQLEAEEAIRHVPGVRRCVNEIVVADMPSVMGFERPE